MVRALRDGSESDPLIAITEQPVFRRSRAISYSVVVRPTPYVGERIGLYATLENSRDGSPGPFWGKTTFGAPGKCLAISTRLTAHWEGSH